MFENYIAGQWRGADTSFQNLNPSDLADNVGAYAVASPRDVDDAVCAANQAVAALDALGVQGRSDMLDSVGRQILDNAPAIGELLAREEGKTLPEATGEAVRAGQIFRFFAAEVLRTGGELLPSVRPGIEVSMSREPVGVVGAITPWNFPIAIPAWKIAPALAYGNTVVCKPSEFAPGCAHWLAQTLADSGLPAGAFNLVMGNGDVGAALVDNPGVDAVSFTGSVNTGRRVAAGTAGRLARVQLEMGGKNPLVVTREANMDIAVECAVQGAFFSTGQRCTASSRLIVESAVHDEFVERVVARLNGLRIGPALEEGVHIGPLASAQQLEKSLEYLRIGREEGAVVACGGERVEAATEGYFLSPALFVDTKNSMRINQEEIFGPVASVIKADGFDAALAIANDTRFGLSAGIVTDSLMKANRFRRDCRAGMIMVNAPTAGVDYHVPFGGMKGSSFGPREQGAYAKEFYTVVKTAYVNAG